MDWKWGGTAAYISSKSKNRHNHEHDQDGSDIERERHLKKKSIAGYIIIML